MPNSERFMSVKIFLIFWCGIVGTKIAVSGFKLYLSIIIYVTIWLLLVVHQWYFMVYLNEMNWKVLFLGQFVFTTTSNWESAISTFPIIATNEFSSSQVSAACFSMAASEEKWVVSYSRKSWGSDQTRPTQVENYLRQSFSLFPSIRLFKLYNNHQYMLENSIWSNSIWFQILCLVKWISYDDLLGWIAHKFSNPVSRL